MAFKAKFLVNGIEYNVKHYHYSGTQPTDSSNKPAAIPIQWYIELTVEASNDSFLYHWFTEPEVSHDGKLVFYNNDIGAAMRTTEFKKRYCVDYDEDFSDTGGQPMIIDIAISAGEVDINGIGHKKPWA